MKYNPFSSANTLIAISQSSQDLHCLSVKWIHSKWKFVSVAMHNRKCYRNHSEHFRIPVPWGFQAVLEFGLTKLEFLHLQFLMLQNRADFPVPKTMLLCQILGDQFQHTWNCQMNNYSLSHSTNIFAQPRKTLPKLDSWASYDNADEIFGQCHQQEVRSSFNRA